MRITYRDGDFLDKKTQAVKLRFKQLRCPYTKDGYRKTQEFCQAQYARRLKENYNKVLLQLQAF